MIIAIDFDGKNKSGIYQILNTKNNKFYIGSSKDLRKRQLTHFSNLRKGTHKNIILQQAYNKYGEQYFKFNIIEEISISDLIIREQFYIDSLKPYYNINQIANSSYGVKRRPETIEKIRQANLGLKHPEWRNVIKSKSQGGKNHWTKKKNFSEESKIKMSNSQKELYNNGYISPRKGMSNSPEAIRQMVDKISKPIIQYDLDLKIIKEWKSSKQASQNGYCAKLIIECCKNKRMKYKNYIWKYKNK